MRRTAFFWLVALAALAPAAAFADPPKRTAEQILDRAVAATGGRAAYARIRSTEARGTISLTAQNIKGSYVIRAKAPNKFVTTQTIQGIGETAQGFDGKIGWAKDPFLGLRTLAGEELAQMRDQAAFNADTRWKAIYPKVEALGIGKVGETPAYRVRLTPKQGAPQVRYFDAKTFLLLRVDTIVVSPQGKIPTESYLSDYRVVDGVKVPFKTRQVVPNTAEVELLMTSVRNNVPIPDAAFALPKAPPGTKRKMP